MKKEGFYLFIILFLALEGLAYFPSGFPAKQSLGFYNITTNTDLFDPTGRHVVIHEAEQIKFRFYVDSDTLPRHYGLDAVFDPKTNASVHSASILYVPDSGRCVGVCPITGYVNFTAAASDNMHNQRRYLKKQIASFVLEKPLDRLTVEDLYEVRVKGVAGEAGMYLEGYRELTGGPNMVNRQLYAACMIGDVSFRCVSADLVTRCQMDHHEQLWGYIKADMLGYLSSIRIPYRILRNYLKVWRWWEILLIIISVGVVVRFLWLRGLNGAVKQRLEAFIESGSGKILISSAKNTGDLLRALVSEFLKTKYGRRITENFKDLYFSPSVVKFMQRVFDFRDNLFGSLKAVWMLPQVQFIHDKVFPRYVEPEKRQGTFDGHVADRMLDAMAVEDKTFFAKINTHVRRLFRKIDFPLTNIRKKLGGVGKGEINEVVGVEEKDEPSQPRDL
ncbi:MAG: hypothetical protein GF334_12680 [Candidatus Altiarchaeales archaeon]|nr:hypothetical protein [Candidatus Altiarchaeales archaeon]